MIDPVIGANATYMSELAKHYKAILQKKMGSTGKDLFDCVITGGVLYSSFKVMGEGIIVARFNYQAAFIFERLPENLIDPRVIMATTTCWLLENDMDRKQQNLASPKMDVEAYSNDDSTSLSDLEITIEFSEPILMKQAQGDNGDISYQGKTWNIEPYVIHTAESTRVLSGAS
ncbi:phage tail protein [Aliivibrio fischeri]|uniref:Phage tail protein n=1 Tax=Aliivibrio fischeri TaxID=668 RepID=A0A510UF82_ALIFS|nr:phage tail protein [Aliivibrio fischeri]GEK13227.1 hypothetical protein AFI02nite_12630 [Aliivibrio fischeri]